MSNIKENLMKKLVMQNFLSNKVIYGFSEKILGSLEPNFGDKSREELVRGRKAVLDKLGVIGEIAIPHSTHSSKSVCVSSSNASSILEADALITNIPTIILTMTGADCFPVYFFDSSKNAIGLAHAGWKGVVGNIMKNTVDQFIKHFNTNPGDLIVEVGPGICKEHYTVDSERAKHFQHYSEFLEKIDDKCKLDLVGIIQKQLREVGVKNIGQNNECTFENPSKYFSHRRDKTWPPQLGLAYIVLR